MATILRLLFRPRSLSIEVCRSEEVYWAFVRSATCGQHATKPAPATQRTDSEIPSISKSSSSSGTLSTGVLRGASPAALPVKIEWPGFILSRWPRSHGAGWAIRWVVRTPMQWRRAANLERELLSRDWLKVSGESQDSRV